MNKKGDLTMEDVKYIISIRLLWIQLRATTVFGAVCILVFEAMLLSFFYLMALQGVTMFNIG